MIGQFLTIYRTEVPEIPTELLRKTTTTLVMKTPKTKTGVRKIFIPKTVAEMLIRYKTQIEDMKQLYGYRR